MGHDAQSIQFLIDSHIDKVNTAIHKATEDAGCIPNRRYKPKPFWCPELSAARDKNVSGGNFGYRTADHDLEKFSNVISK